MEAPGVVRGGIARGDNDNVTPYAKRRGECRRWAVGGTNDDRMCSADNFDLREKKAQ